MITGYLLPSKEVILEDNHGYIIGTWHQDTTTLTHRGQTTDLQNLTPREICQKAYNQFWEGLK